MLLGAGVAALLFAALGWGLLHAARAAPRSLEGQVAPDVTIRALDDGREIGISDLRGTPVVLNFWASWCVPCRKEAPILNAAARAYSGRIQFIGADIQDSDAPARSYQAEIQSPYPVGPITHGSYRDYGVTAPPETFFIDRQGRVVVKVLGAIDQRRMDIDMSLLKG